MPAVELHGVTKRYGRVEALAGIDLTVPEGAVFGLMAPTARASPR